MSEFVLMTNETNVLFYRDSTASYLKQPEDWQRRTQEYEAAARRTGMKIFIVNFYLVSL